MAWANIDLGGGWWVIPAERSKNGLAHRVPLSPQVVAILQDLQAHVGASSTWVFATPSASGYRETVQIATRRIRRRSGLEFVVRRFARLYPAFLVGICLTLAVAGISAIPAFKRSFGDVLANLTMNAPAFHRRWVDGAYWSLAVEIKVATSVTPASSG